MANELRGRGPRNYTRTDERIREDVCERLTDDAYVDPTDIEVTVSAGLVRLNGRVCDRDMKWRAEDIAESVSGVREVENHIRLADAWQPLHEGRPDSAESGVSATTGSEGGGTKLHGELRGA